MSNSLLHLLLAMVFLLVSITSCGLFEKPKNQRKGDGGRRIYVNGKIDALLEGTEAQNKSFFKVSNVEEFKDFSLVSHVLFAERSTYQARAKTTQSDIEKQNSTSDSKFEREFDSYTFMRSSEKSYIYSDTVNNDLSLYFDVNSDSLDLSSVEFVKQKAVFAVLPIHLSVNRDRTAFSILAETSIQGTKALLAIYFVKNVRPLTILENVEKIYQYLNGSGVRFRWKDKIEPSLCGELILSKESARRQNIMEWAVENKIGGREVGISTLKNPKPFSDVTQNCIYSVENYFFENNPTRGSILGLTIPVMNSSTSEIVSASIMVATSTLAKIGSKEKEFSVQDYEKMTYVHEFGHFLGLGHEFLRDRAGVAVYPSVMSYDNVFGVQEHDFKAIEKLYQ